MNIRRQGLSFMIFVLGTWLGSAGIDAQCVPNYPENLCPCGNGTCDPGEDRLSCAADCPSGCNHDGICEPDADENSTDCPLDCPGPCIDACEGRCGEQPRCDGGGTFDCGPCEDPPVCLTPLFTASTTNAEVGQPIEFAADPTRVLFDPAPQWDMGNGVHLTGAQVTYAYPAAGTYPVILTASDLACGETRLSAPVTLTVTEPGPITCDFTGVPPHLQRCCGDETCQDAETPDDCPADCPASCGDAHCSVTQGEDPNSCPLDCCPSGTVCAAGCASLPTFTVSNPNPGRLQEITVTANASLVQGATVNWDFGDGQHCEGCPLTASHRYELQGNYELRLTATDSVCGSTMVSVPWVINVGPAPPKPWAQIVDSGLPACVRPGEGAPASIHVRNIGGTTWGPNTTDALGIVEPPLWEPLFTPAGIQVTEVVPPGGDYTFSFNFGATGAPVGEHTIVYRMVNATDGHYGDPASHRVTVSENCSTTPPPPPVGDYTCRASLHHPGGGGVPGIPVELASFAFEPSPRGERENRIHIDTGETKVDGNVDLAIQRDPSRPATRVTCRFMGDLRSLALNGPPQESRVHSEEVAPTHIDLARLVQPTYSRTITVTGLQKDVSAVARLYQSGPYDKPVVIPKPFDRAEQTEDRMTPAKMEKKFREFLDAANEKGYDVWLTNTRTGQNIHEQAAEFAQVIDTASRLLEPNGPVIVAGYSLGGVTARLATARYQADPAWRIALGVQPDLPVSLIAFGDAPLRGANISFGLQRALWEDLPGQAEAQANLNSCGAQQLLRSSYPSDSGNFRKFWETGEPVYFNGSGVCDAPGPGYCVCEAGPPVFSVNGNGWAQGIPIVAFADSYPGPQACYGGGADIDGGDNDVCEHLYLLFDHPALPVSYPFLPAVGTPLFRMQVPFWEGAPDFWVHATAEDVAPGSRLSNATKTLLGYGIGAQVFGPTFVPLDSALPEGAPFLATQHANHNAVHGVGVEDNIYFLLQQMESLTGVGSATTFAIASAPGAWPSTAAGETPLEVRFPSPDHVPATTLGLTIGTSGPPPPSGYVHGDAARYYTVGMNPAGAEPATWREPMTVCLDYAGTTFMDESRILLFHQEAVGWVEVTSHVDAESKRVCGNVTTLATLALFEPQNQVPVVHAGTDRVVQAASEDGAEVALVPSGTHDPDEEPLTYEWRDQGGGLLAETAALSRVLPLGTHELTLSVRDPRGGEASDTVVVTVTGAPPQFVSEYQVGDWGVCASEGAWTCVSDGPLGCTRSGTQTRSVSPSSWTADPGQAVPEPPSSQACTETTTGFVAEYYAGTWGSCSGTTSWTCTSATAAGCSRPGAQTRTVTASSWTDNAAQAQPAPGVSLSCTETTQGYIATYAVGGWSQCSATCGGGYQTRSVAPSSYMATAPSASAPDAVQSCTGESCTCDDMGWYAADQRDQCDSECGSACTKKSWCGSNECEPWPHYCWKC